VAGARAKASCSLSSAAVDTGGVEPNDWREPKGSEDAAEDSPWRWPRSCSFMGSFTRGLTLVHFSAQSELFLQTDRLTLPKPTSQASRTLTTQFGPRAKWAHLLLAKMSQIGACLYAQLVFHIFIFSISTV
jgi:hypothetical protein